MLSIICLLNSTLTTFGYRELFSPTTRHTRIRCSGDFIAFACSRSKGCAVSEWHCSAESRHIGFSAAKIAGMNAFLTTVSWKETTRRLVPCRFDFVVSSILSFLVSSKNHGRNSFKF